MISGKHSIADADRNLPSLVRGAELGKTVKLPRRGEPVAVPAGCRAFKQLVGGRQGVLEAYPDFTTTVDMVALALHPDGMLPAVRDLTPRRDVRAQAVRYLRDTGRVSEPVRPNPLPGFWRSFASSSRQGDRGGARPGTRGPRRYREDTAIHQRADCSKIACQQHGSGFAEHIRFQETPRVASAKLGSSSYSKYDMAIVKRPQAS